MSKQHNLNSEFARIIGDKIETLNFMSASDVVHWLLKNGIIAERTVIHFMTVQIYRMEIQKTKSRLRPNGCEGIAVSNTKNAVPVSERQIRTYVKRGWR